MAELGIDISKQESKRIDRFEGQQFDRIVTVCDHAKESCPLLPGARETLHWSFDDPAEATGSDEERMAVFRRVRDEIHRSITRPISNE